MGVENSLISVIVPVYNAEDYLHDCINSVLSQSYHNLELILVDDSSTDTSATICKEWQEKDHRVRYIRVPNGGVSYARNIGIDHAQGDLIAFLDSDDWMTDGSLEMLHDKLVEYDADISIGNYMRYVDDTQQFLLHVYNTPYYEEAWTGRGLLEVLPYLEVRDIAFASPCGRLYKRELFDLARFPEGRVIEDLAINYRLYGNASKIVYVHKEVFVWRKRNESQSGQFDARLGKAYILDYLQALDERMTYMAFRNIPLEPYKELYRSRLSEFKGRCEQNDELRGTVVEKLVDERIRNFNL